MQVRTDSVVMRRPNEKIKIPVLLNNQTYIDVVICEESSGTIHVIDEAEAKENGESPYQLVEGKSYEYYFPEGYELEKSEIVRPSKIRSNTGHFVTNVYVGTFETNILWKEKVVGKISLEIRSCKTGYRNDYRQMLEDITGKCTDLLMRHSSAIYQQFIVDAGNDSQTLYQRFAFVNSIIRSDMFQDAIHRVNTMPVKKWESTERQIDICNVRRVNSSAIRQMMVGSKRTPLSTEHSLKNQFHSLPNKINVIGKKDTTDIPENRFVKYVIETFIRFCYTVYHNSHANDRLKRESRADIDFLSHYLSLPVFRDVSRLDMIPMHSPVLQRKGGYREILQTYLMFDMAAKLVWSGGDEVYKAGKRDVAVLYEYWIFFKLLDLMEEVFGIKPKSIDEIIKPKGDGTLELSLKQGKEKMIDGIYIADNRQLHIEFYYNRTFTCADNYPGGGSWTRGMRPDYTLSIRPAELTRIQAEEREMITHIHFDAKYKIESYESIFRDVENPDDEKIEESKGNYKRADLLKMHAYKDAIRRTAGAYILYPGTGKRTFRNFHEILPGIGAFAVSPRNSDDSGLKDFLIEVAQLLQNRTSQCELFSYRIFETFRELPGSGLKEVLPETDSR